MRAQSQAPDLHDAAAEFADIRPYRDQEVRGVLARLAREPELLDAVARFRAPWLARFAPGLARAATGRVLAARTSSISSVRQFQQFLESFVERMVRASTDGFGWSGVRELARDHAHLFISNHRDIAMDSGFLNYALWREGFDTARIAVGDNLLGRPFATDLMRLNKSFVVRRSAVGVKEMAAAFNLTSRYVHHSIAEGQSVWIAQREGRAKDGRDLTEPAIIKMFHMSRRKSGERFGTVIAGLHPVPVAISYEVDPCAPAKARELFLTARDGQYVKPEGEDLRAIVTGITGYKGRVHIGFGTELSAGFDNADAVAEEIDRQIHATFRLWPTHLWAAEQQGIEIPATLRAQVDGDNPRALQTLRAQVDEAPSEHRPYLLEQYANPVRSRLGRAEPG